MVPRCTSCKSWVWKGNCRFIKNGFNHIETWPIFQRALYSHHICQVLSTLFCISISCFYYAMFAYCKFYYFYQKKDVFPLRRCQLIFNLSWEGHTSICCYQIERGALPYICLWSVHNKVCVKLTGFGKKSWLFFNHSTCLKRSPDF